MIRNWCCSFIMCSYETVFWLPSFCLLLWRWGWPVNDWNVSSCLLYTCETAYYNKRGRLPSSTSSASVVRHLHSVTSDADSKQSKKLYIIYNMKKLLLLRILAVIDRYGPKEYFSVYSVSLVSEIRYILAHVWLTLSVTCTVPHSLMPHLAVDK